MNEELYYLPDKDREDNEANAAFFTINVVSLGRSNQKFKASHT